MDILSEQEGNDRIKDLLNSPGPAMISRIGKVEADCLNNALRGFPWDDNLRYAASNNAGVFPPTGDILSLFCRVFSGSIRYTDVLSVWLNGEEDPIIDRFCPKATLVKLRCLEPYYHNNPWSQVLEHKNVLVVHPFEKTIQSQYEKRALLFKDPRVLPEFNLLTMKAVQSSAGNRVPYESWLDALDWMCDEISRKTFDIAIIGAGSYGLPLASFVKSLGKKAIQIAGATQILFGIKGKRWDDHEVISTLYNEHWVRPLPEETPPNYLAIENGCYW